MAEARKTKAHIEAEKKVTELEKKLSESERMRDYHSKLHTELNTIIEGIHDVLDDLGIKRYRDENNRYQSIPLTVRLFSWAMSLANKTVNADKGKKE